MSHHPTRREFMKRAGLMAGGAAFGLPLLQACDAKQTAATGAGSAMPSPAIAPGGAVLVTREGDAVVSLFTTMADEYFNNHVAGTKQCAQALGLKYEGFVNENKPEVQLSQFETAAGRGVKMITVVPPDVANVPGIYRRANENKIHTVTTAELPPWYFPHTEGEFSVTYITPYDYKSYGDVTRTLCERLGGKGRVLMITGFPGGTPDTQRTAAAKKVVSEHPEMSILASLPGRWNRVDGRKAMEDLMASHHDFEGVLCLNDEMAIGALSALSDAGRNDVPVVGHNGTAEIMQFIKQGRVLATASTFPFWIGAYMVALAFDAANGWKPRMQERMLVAQHAVIDPSNVDKYIDRFVTHFEQLPFDFKKMSKVLHPQDWDPQNLVYPLDAAEYFSHTPGATGTLPDDWQASLKDAPALAQEYQQHYQSKILG